MFWEMMLQACWLHFAGRISSPKHHKGDFSKTDSTIVSPGVEKTKGHC